MEAESKKRTEAFTKVSTALTNEMFDWEFNTFDDPRLVKLLDSVKAWCMIPNSKKSMLTLSGPTERGKTHLLKKIKELHDRFDCNFPKKRQNYPTVNFVSWGKFTKETLDVRNYFDEVEYSGIVLIDDFLSEFYDLKVRNGWHDIVLSKAFDILNARVGKPTVITTNLSSKDLELLDPRIHSRLFREGGEFKEISTSVKKYLTR